jgi:hypothetical protein
MLGRIGFRCNNLGCKSKHKSSIFKFNFWVRLLKLINFMYNKNTKAFFLEVILPVVVISFRYLFKASMVRYMKRIAQTIMQNHSINGKNIFDFILRGKYQEYCWNSFIKIIFFKYGRPYNKIQILSMKILHLRAIQFSILRPYSHETQYCDKKILR